MGAAHADEIIKAYLARVDAAAGRLSPAARRDLVEDLSQHILEARGQLGNETDADVMNILERLGTPQSVVGDPPAAEPSTRTPWLEISTIAALVLVWPVGFVLLWTSKIWTTRDRLVAILVPPGGYFGLLIFGLLSTGAVVGTSCMTVTSTLTNGTILPSTACSSSAQSAITNAATAAVVMAWLVIPLLTAAYLGWRLRSSIARRPELALA